MQRLKVKHWLIKIEEHRCGEMIKERKILQASLSRNIEAVSALKKKSLWYI